MSELMILISVAEYENLRKIASSKNTTVFQKTEKTANNNADNQVLAGDQTPTSKDSKKKMPSLNGVSGIKPENNGVI